jgi:hypothetical protein
MKTPDELFRHIQNYSARPGGIPINFIKQNYTGSILYSDLLKTWEDEGKVLIMRFSQKATIPEPGAKPKKVVQAKGEDGSKTIMETGVNTWKAVMYDQVDEGEWDEFLHLGSSLTDVRAGCSFPDNVGFHRNSRICRLGEIIDRA